MARSDDTQHYQEQVQKDFGTVILGAAGTATFSTYLGNVRSGTANHQSGSQVASTLQVGALSSGTVTITDSAGAANADAVVAYCLFGLPA